MITELKQFACDITDELEECLGQMDPMQAGRLYEDVKKADRVFAWAPGRCQAMLRCFITNLQKAGKTAYFVGDTVTPAIGEGDLLIIASGAGHNIGVASIGERARRFGATVALLTIVKESLCQSVSSYIVVIPGRTAACGGIGTSIQPGGGKYEQSMFLLLEAFMRCYCLEKTEQIQITPEKLIGTAIGITRELKEVESRVEEAEADALFSAVNTASEKGNHVFVWSFVPRQLTLMRCYLMRLMHMYVKAFVWGDTVCPEPEKNDVFIVSDAFGNDEVTKTVIRRMADRGLQVFVLSSNRKAADIQTAGTVWIPAGKDSDLRTQQLFEQSMLILLDAMIAKHNEEMGFERSAAFMLHANLE